MPDTSQALNFDGCFAKCCFYSVLDDYDETFQTKQIRTMFRTVLKTCL